MTEAEFRAQVKTWVQSHNLNRRTLAAAFEVSQSVVDLWWLGVDTPHPRLQAQVVAWIAERSGCAKQPE